MKTLSVLLFFLSFNHYAQVKDLILMVEVPHENDTLYITGNQPSLGDWNPVAVVMKKTSAKERSITLPVSFPVEFKFTRGSWDSEGYTGDKWNRDNIRITDPVKQAKYKILGWYDEGNYAFDKKYILANKGRYSIEVPEVQELVHLIFALTKTGVEDENLVNQEGEYYREVMQEFGSYKDDPFVLHMNSLLKKGMYAILKMDACGFYFEGDEIKKDKVYNKLSWGGPNSLEQYIPELEKFGKKINFRAFYAKNFPYYQELIKRMEVQASVQEQWDWLEDNFDLKYDNYRITFSPLVKGSHSTNKFVQSDFKQTVMFISGPVDNLKYNDEMQKGIMNRIIFTEIDHNYVNPVSDMYAKEIKSVIPNLTVWATPEALKYYHNEYMVFNEYVTWGVYSLYAQEKFNKESFDTINEDIETMMTERRGFTKYKDFNRKLMQLYANREAGQKIPDLYPKILEYFKTSVPL